MTSYDKMQMLRDEPIYHAMLSAILTEEVRHGSDLADYYRNHDMKDPPGREDWVARFKPGSVIRKGFLEEDTFPTDEKESLMLGMAIAEVLGKMTTAGVAFDPDVELAQWEMFIEHSRVLGGRQYQTFARDLESAHALFSRKKGDAQEDVGGTEKKLESWQHALAVKIATLQIGNTMGFSNRRLALDAEYDHHEFRAILRKLLRLPVTEQRLALKRSTDDEFMNPIDSPPFHKIDEKTGNLVRRND